MKPVPMKLQWKPAGAWRDVVEFDSSRLLEVEAAAIVLARALGTGSRRADGAPPVFRTIVAKGRSPQVFGYLQLSATGTASWRNP